MLLYVSLLFDRNGLKMNYWSIMMKFVNETCDNVSDHLPSVPCRGKDGPCSLRNGKGSAELNLTQYFWSRYMPAYLYFNLRHSR